jgi:hypothetical protein
MKNKFLQLFAAALLLSFLVLSCSDDEDDTPSNQPPEIVLYGGSSISLLLNKPYEEPGFYAVDDKDTNLTASIVVTGSINSDSAAKQTISYTVTDSQGETTTEERTVNVYNQISQFNGVLYGKMVDSYPGTEPVKYAEYGQTSISVNNQLILQNFAGVDSSNVEIILHSNPEKDGQVEFVNQNQTLNGKSIKIIKGTWTYNNIYIHFKKADGSEVVFTVDKK